MDINDKYFYKISKRENPTNNADYVEISYYTGTLKKLIKNCVKKMSTTHGNVLFVDALSTTTNNHQKCMIIMGE